jgi:hypothetical protein
MTRLFFLMKQWMPLPALLMVFILSASHVPAASAGTAEAKWVFAGFTKYRDAVFIDMNRLTYTARDQAGIWSRITPAEQSKYFKQIRRDLKKVKKAGYGFRHLETLNEIDCLNKKIRYLEVIYYDRESRVIHATRDENPAWKKINTGSLWDSLQTAVCKNELRP